MTIDVSLLSPSTQSWAQNLGNSTVELRAIDAPVGDEVPGVPYFVQLEGVPAAAFLFGQALRTVNYVDTQDGLQFSDARFEFPPGSGSRVTLAELADALRYKYGVDPLIEFAPGLGLRAYSVTDINNILQLINREFADVFREPEPGEARLPLLAHQAVFDSVSTNWNLSPYRLRDELAANSKAVLAPATDAELRRDLTEGGDIYIDRHGGFYINGVATDAMDLAVTSRLLAQDNIGSEYKVIMDEYAERNNLIAAANKTLAVINNEALSNVERGLALSATIDSLNTQYGEDDMLAVLTAGKITLDQLNAPGLELIASTEVYLDRLDTRITAMKDFYADARADAEIRKDFYFSYRSSSNLYTGLTASTQFLHVNMLIEKIDRVLEHLDEGLGVVRFLNDELSQSMDDFKEELEVQKAQVGTDNVFQWLRSFDVDPDYLWQGDWETYIQSQTIPSLSSQLEYAPGNDYLDQNAWGFFDLTHWQTGGAKLASNAVTSQPNEGASTDFSDEMFDFNVITPNQFDDIEASLNTLISNKVRDGELDQAKLQTLTAQLQNNTEAMTAMIKVFSTMYNALAQSLR